MDLDMGENTIQQKRTRNPFAMFAPLPVGVSFDEQDEGENIVLLLRAHIVTLVPALLEFIVLLVLPLVAFLMNFRLINLKVGSAISTASWYAALVFGLWRTNKFSFFVLMGLYLGLIFVTYYILEFFRSRAIKTK